jgi:hypothetical protein
MTSLDPLDLLYQELTVARQAKKVKSSPHQHKRPDPGYFDPSTWHQVRVVTLIHKPSDTVLGNFRELHHPRLPGGRKLTRVEEPCATEALEYVTGELWLTLQAVKSAKPENWVTHQERVIAITLVECGLYCPDAEVRVRLQHGGIARVELMSDTRFGCPARDSFLIFPKGLDVLGVMDLDSKLDLYHELTEGDLNG